MRIYLDVCCLNRPFDDQSHERIRLEAEAILLIWQRIRAGEWQLVSSDMVVDEVAQTPDLHRRERLQALLPFATNVIRIDEAIKQRAREFLTAGLTAADALHVACAENGRVDAFLTTDDRLLGKLHTASSKPNCRVDNPLLWLLEQNR